MLYIRLFHGRKHIYQELDDWGSDGPILGPYDCIHTTYAGCIKMSIKDTLNELFVVDDVLFYGGVFYGDWSVFDADRLSDEEKAYYQKYDARKSVIPSLINEQRPPIKVVVFIRGGVCEDVKCNLARADWKYSVVDYDNNPDLKDNSGHICESRIVPLTPKGYELAMTAKEVIDNWPTSNLAGSVRKLGNILKSILPSICGN
jgi:hypothetical protein